MEKILDDVNHDIKVPFAEIQILAERTKDKTIIAFVDAVKKLFILTTDQITSQHIKDSVCGIDEAFQETELFDSHHSYYIDYSRRIVRILDGDLRIAVNQKRAGTMLNEIKRLKLALHDMVLNYK